MQNRQNDNKDSKIISLLGVLEKRLIRNEEERNEIRRSLSALEDRSSRNEKTFLTVHARLNRADRLEAQMREQAGRLEKAEALAERIEEALVHQDRLARRLEKISKDRVRMQDRLERIEETVIQTRDAISAKPAVFLPHESELKDQDNESPYLSASSEKKQTALTEQNTKDEPEEHLWWQTAMAAAILILGVAGGWAFQEIQQGQSLPAYEDLPADTGDTVLLAGLPADDHPVDPAEPIREDSDPPLSFPVTQETSLAALDDEALRQQMALNPDDLAALLNTINPAGDKSAPAEEVASSDSGTLTNTAPKEATLVVSDITVEEESTPAKEPETVSAEPAPTPEPAKETRAVKAEPKPETAPAEPEQKEPEPKPARVVDISPDPALPGVVREIEKKAFEGIAAAQHDLAAIYTAGHAGVTPDYQKAAAWFREAAAQGVANARYNLGVLYHQGLGVDADIAQAVRWYNEAALLGHAEALYNLGIAHIEGVGTPYDPQKAAGFFEQAANKNVPEAAYNLGLIHENGLLGAPDSETALYWYRRAVESGSKDALAALNQLSAVTGQNPASAGRTEPQKSPAPVPTSMADEPQTRQVRSDPPPAPTEGGLSVTGLTMQDTLAYTASPPDSDLVIQVQNRLTRIGLYPGPSDGIIGPRTEDAIRTYQRYNDLAIDGQPSMDLLAHLLENTGPAAGTEEGSREE